MLEGVEGTEEDEVVGTQVAVVGLELPLATSVSKLDTLLGSVPMKRRHPEVDVGEEVLGEAAVVVVMVDETRVAVGTIVLNVNNRVISPGTVLVAEEIIASSVNNQDTCHGNAQLGVVAEEQLLATIVNRLDISLGTVQLGAVEDVVAVDEGVEEVVVDLVAVVEGVEVEVSPLAPELVVDSIVELLPKIRKSSLTKIIGVL